MKKNADFRYRARSHRSAHAMRLEPPPATPPQSRVKERVRLPRPDDAPADRTTQRLMRSISQFRSMEQAAMRELVAHLLEYEPAPQKSRRRIRVRL